MSGGADPFASIAQPATQADPFASIAQPAQQSEPKTAGFYKRLTAPYNPQVEESNVLVRGLDAAGGALLSTPGAVYHAFADAPTAEEQAKYPGDTGGLKRVGLGLERLITDPVESAVKDYASGKVTPSAALSVLPEAIGVGVGSQAAGELAGRGLSKVGELRTQFKDSMGGGKLQPFARKVTQAEAAFKDKVSEAAEKHAGAEVKHAEATGDVAARQDLAKKLDQSSVKLGEHIKNVEKSVGAEGDAKFDKVREKLGITDDNPGPEVPPDKLVATVRNVETQTLQNIPEKIKEFRAIYGHGEEAPEGLGEGFKKATGEAPLGGLPFTWDKLQSLKTRIQMRLRNSRGMNPDLQRGLGQLLDVVVEEMGGIAEPHGASALWKEAKDFWRGYKQDFHEPTGKTGSPVAASLGALDPARIRRPFTGDANSTLGNRGVEILRKYPQHGGNEAAATAEEMLGHHESLRRMPDKAPPKPLQAPVVDAVKVSREAIEKRARNWGSYNARDVGILGSSVLGPLIAGTLLGHPVTGGLIALADTVGYGGAKYAASRILSSPSVVDWLSNTPPEEIAALQRIPGADKVRIINALTEQATKAGRPVRLSPEARQLIGPANAMRIATASGAVAGQQIQNRKDALDLLSNPPF